MLGQRGCAWAERLLQSCPPSSPEETAEKREEMGRGGPKGIHATPGSVHLTLKATETKRDLYHDVLAAGGKRPSLAWAFVKPGGTVPPIPS